MLVRKGQGNCSIGEYRWEHDGDVIEVPDWLGIELVSTKGGDCTEVQAARVTAEEPAGPPESSGVPDGTSVEVLEWVGDDAAKARQAIDFENAKEKPRTTLIGSLEKITGK